MNSRFFMGPASRIEVDFSLCENAWTNVQSRVFGSDGDAGTTVSLYINSVTNFSFGAGDVFKGHDTGLSAEDDDSRHVAIVDAALRKMFFVTDGYTNEFSFSSDTIVAVTATNPIALFGDSLSASGTRFFRTSAARIYGAKFYDGGRLVHDYSPCVKGGVPGFLDAVDGAFVTSENPSALAARGDVAVVDDDGYVATPGNNVREGWLYIDTGCYASNGTTRVELDYALLENYPASGGGDWYLFDGGYYPSGASSVKRFAVYFNKSGMGWIASDSDSAAAKSEIPAAVRSKDVRRTVSIDAYGRKFSVVTAGFTNWTENAVNTSLDFSTHTLKVASSFTGSTAHSPLKIYGVRIYERGVLVRDFRPYVKDGIAGLRDTLDHSRFTAAMVVAQLACGGEIENDGTSLDAYVESDGTQSVDTGFLAHGGCRIEVDFRLSDARGGGRAVFGAWSGNGWNSVIGAYANGGQFNLGLCGADSSHGGWKMSAMGAVDMARHTAVIDAVGQRLLLATGASTNTVELDYSHPEKSTKPVALFSGVNSDGSPGLSTSAARIYAVRMYDGGSLVHEFLPYTKGDVVGFFDTATGEAKTNVLNSSSPLRVGGIGWDGSGAKFVLEPESVALSRTMGSTTLSAYAPGAVSYRWLKNGERVLGGEDGELRIEWEKGGRTDEYRAIAVYSVYGRTVEGEPGRAAAVWNAPPATYMYFR